MLEDLKIAKPCPANWDAMSGDERVRFCGECKLHVYNLSAMTRPEADALMEKTEGKVCVRLYQRADGTVITQDCPVGLAALRRRVATLAASAFAVVAVGFGTFFGPREESDSSRTEGTARAAATTTTPDGKVVNQPEPPKKPRALMGAPMPTRRDPAPKMGEVQVEKKGH